MSDNGYASESELVSGELKRRYDDFTLPVADRKVRIQSLSELELSRYQAESFAADGRTIRKSMMLNANGRLIILCVVDAAGNRILNKSHLQKISTGWDGADSAALYDKCAEHCGITRQGVDAIAKNSDETPDASQPTEEQTGAES